MSNVILQCKNTAGSLSPMCGERWWETVGMGHLWAVVSYSYLLEQHLFCLTLRREALDETLLSFHVPRQCLDSRILSCCVWVTDH